MKRLKTVGIVFTILYSSISLGAGSCNFQSDAYKVSMQIQDYGIGDAFEVRDPGRYPCIIDNAQGPVTTIVCRNRNEPDNFTMFGGTCSGAPFTSWVRELATLYRCQAIEVSANNLTPTSTNEYPVTKPPTFQQSFVANQNVTATENTTCQIPGGTGMAILTVNSVAVGSQVTANGACTLVNNHILVCNFPGGTNIGVTVNTCRGTKFVVSGNGYECQQELL